LDTLSIQGCSSISDGLPVQRLIWTNRKVTAQFNFLNCSTNCSDSSTHQIKNYDGSLLRTQDNQDSGTDNFRTEESRDFKTDNNPSTGDQDNPDSNREAGEDSSETVLKSRDDITSYNQDFGTGDSESRNNLWNDPDLIEVHWTEDEPPSTSQRLEDYERGDLVWFINDKGRWVKGFVHQRKYQHDENFRHKEFYGLLCKEGVWQISGGVLIPHGYEACILPRQAERDEAERTFPEANTA